MNILQAIHDPNLFRPFLADAGGGLSSWQNWFSALRVLDGLPVAKPRQAVVEQCTGRAYSQLPDEGFDAALFLTGRRSGKSRIAAVVGAFEAALAGHEIKLAKGERGIVAVLAPTKHQGRIVKGYLRAIFETPLLHAEVAAETREGFELNNGVRIEILAGDFRTIRGYTLLAAIVDELAFFGLSDDSHVKSDTELVRAVQPSLATVGGRLIMISTPYARRGYCWSQFKKNWGNDAGKILVWNSPSRTMNPMLPQSVVDAALADDLQSAKSEYLGEFRDDVCEFLPRSVVESLVVKDRLELMSLPNIRYSAFADLSGGRNDDAALAIGHRQDRKVIVDCLKRYRPPFNPHSVVREMAEQLQRYGLRRVTGDNYAAEFVARAFEGCGVTYTKSDKPKSALYLELLPRLCSGEIELPDNEVLVDQLANLERRTRSGGKDIVDHGPGGHDDLANVIAGVSDVAAANRIRVGAL